MSNGLPVIEKHKLGFRATQNGLWATGVSRQEALRNLKRHQQQTRKRATAEQAVRQKALSGETPAVFSLFTVSGGVVCVLGLRVGLGADKAEAFANALNNTTGKKLGILESAKVIQGEDGTFQVQTPWLVTSGKTRNEAERRLTEIATAIINWIVSGKARPPMAGFPPEVVHYEIFNRGRWGSGDTLVAARNQSAQTPPVDLPITHFLPTVSEHFDGDHA